MKKNSGKGKPDINKALVKAQRYCAYQERCQQEVRARLYEWGLYSRVVESIIAELITNNFINEERFSKVYAGGKFRIKKWGRIKIRQKLREKNITKYCIEKGFEEILYKKTNHYELYKSFLNNPEYMLKKLKIE